MQCSNQPSYSIAPSARRSNDSRTLKTERFRSLEVDDQLEFCRLHDSAIRQPGGGPGVGTYGAYQVSVVARVPVALLAPPMQEPAWLAR
jgi:hypothetical protein